jgi:predicted nucleic acid-binding Zn ribbon protein
MKKPQPLHSILEQTLKGLELDVPLKIYSIWGAWKEIVGEPIALQTQPHAIRNRILLVEVSHSTWMQQLQFLKPILLGKINRFLGESLIEDIRFKVGKIPPAVTPVPKRKEEREEGLDRKTIDRIERLLEKITDEEVKKGFRNLLIKSAKLKSRGRS